MYLISSAYLLKIQVINFGWWMMLDCIKWYYIQIYARPIIFSLIFIISMQTTTSDACTTNSLQFSPKSNCDSKLACWGFQTSNAVTRRPTSNFVSNNVPNFISEKCFIDIASVLSTIEVSILHCIGINYLPSVIPMRDRLFAIQIRDYLCMIDVILSNDSWEQCCFYHIYR